MYGLYLPEFCMIVLACGLKSPGVKTASPLSCAAREETGLFGSSVRLLGLSPRACASLDVPELEDELRADPIRVLATLSNWLRVLSISFSTSFSTCFLARYLLYATG